MNVLRALTTWLDRTTDQDRKLKLLSPLAFVFTRVKIFETKKCETHVRRVRSRCFYILSDSVVCRQLYIFNVYRSLIPLLFETRRTTTHLVFVETNIYHSRSSQIREYSIIFQDVFYRNSVYLFARHIFIFKSQNYTTWRNNPRPWWLFFDFLEPLQHEREEDKFIIKLKIGIAEVYGQQYWREQDHEEESREFEPDLTRARIMIWAATQKIIFQRKEQGAEVIKTQEKIEWNRKKFDFRDILRWENRAILKSKNKYAGKDAEGKRLSSVRAGGNLSSIFSFCNHDGVTNQRGRIVKLGDGDVSGWWIY